MSAARAIEIERKFLVRSDAWRPRADGTRYRQGYLCRSDRATVRVRLAGPIAWLAIKHRIGPKSVTEFEYTIPADEARELLETSCQGHLVDKTRYRVRHERHVWEVDEFHGDNQGLVVAEVELASLEVHPALPEWVGAEVTGQVCYYNAYLSQHPFREWAKDPGEGQQRQ